MRCGVLSVLERLLPGSRFANFFKRTYFSPSQAIIVEPIGQLQAPRENIYEPGQLFLHRHFGYRGLIIQSWTAKLFDRNQLSLKATFVYDILCSFPTISELTTHEYKSEDATNIYMYQVLTDQRDTDLCNAALKPGITFLPDDKRIFNTIYIVSGMDYVFHDDIIPFSSQDSVPIKNEYVQEFFIPTADREPSFLPTDHLRRWIEARKQSLEVTCVHREVTEGVRTTTVPFFMGRRLTGDKSEKHVRYWRYFVRLENLNPDRIQLRERFWKIFSITGSLESVRGKGVVGMQPVLSAESPVFQYHSHVQVPVPWAHMWGSFRFERPNGSSFDVKIPSFPLCDRAYWSGTDEPPMN
ncbi:hypothetical protein EG68_11426 [Paragonimus skrjabini miyazakii]|uniref:ApaG domain-containing protein n=1 Tax=Paragonimus skrjabini miyazakii TaxID=59628 RepID=A0A8S9Y8H6_9TREM|nr:hypothetical protein EG68_11426 [Paragonimus skrjabini miyazakii]